MAKFCKFCVKGIRGIEFAKCSGCDQLYHFTCCNMNRSNYEVVTTCSLWLCDECRLLIENKSLKEILTANQPLSLLESLQQQIEQLKNQISSLVDMIKINNANVDSSIQQLEKKLDVHNNQTDAAPVPLRWDATSPSRLLPQRETMQSVSIARPLYDKSAQGTSEHTFDISVPSLTSATNDRFWLYLSGLHPLITNDDIQLVVMKCLNLELPCDVVKLVPKDKDTSNLTFVSFKIGLPIACKTAALLPDTWPKGIRFREFENKSKTLLYRQPL